MVMGYYFRRLLIALGWELCPICGSKNVTVRGFKGTRRFSCNHCGSEIRVD
jgi:transposase-like protein